MKKENKATMPLSVKILIGVLIVFGSTTYLLSNNVSSASESSANSQFSTFNVSATDEKTKLSTAAIQYEPNIKAEFKGKAPLQVTFDSRKLVGPMESCTWNFGDGEMAQGPVASHIFTSEGIYSVTLVAKRKTGQIHQEQLTVSVTPQ